MREEQANALPHFSGFDDYLRKGVPFLLSKNDGINVVGKVRLFPCFLTDDSQWMEDNDFFDERSAIEIGLDNSDPQDNDEPYGGLIDINLSIDEYGEKDIEFFDRSGAKLPYEPWSGSEMHLVETLWEKHGNKLKGLVKNAFFNEMTLLVKSE